MQGLVKKMEIKKINRKQLAVKIGITSQAIYNYETGKRFPRKEMLNKLCEFFNCKIDDLL